VQSERVSLAVAATCIQLEAKIHRRRVIIHFANSIHTYITHIHTHTYSTPQHSPVRPENKVAHRVVSHLWIWYIYYVVWSACVMRAHALVCVRLIAVPGAYTMVTGKGMRSGRKYYTYILAGGKYKSACRPLIVFLYKRYTLWRILTIYLRVSSTAPSIPPRRRSRTKNNKKRRSLTGSWVVDI